MLVKKFKTLYVDPPWYEQGGGKTKRGADRHYPLMKTKDIAALPVSKLAADDGAHLYLWVTNNFLEDGLEVMKEWGFRYITNIVWGKEGPSGLGQYFRGGHELLLFGVRGMVPYKKDENGKRCQGRTFYETSVATDDQIHALADALLEVNRRVYVASEQKMWEDCLRVARGVVESLGDTRAVDVIRAPRTTHSTKPPIFRTVIEHVSTGPYLELFARERHLGWSAWGNEVPGGNDVELVDGNWVGRETPEVDLGGAPTGLHDTFDEKPVPNRIFEE